MINPQAITLIGAGLAGSLLAIYFAKKGFDVAIYEHRDDMRTNTEGGGRSINLALSTRGIFPLTEVGLIDPIMAIAVPMKGRKIHPLSGDQFYQPYGKNDQEVIYSVSRKELNCQLMNLAEATGKVKILFNQRCLQYDVNTKVMNIKDLTNNKDYTITPEVVIGTDGWGSAIRQSFLRLPRVDYSQTHLSHGYKELTIPAGPNGEFLLDKNALHIWPRGSFMLIALPNIDGSFTCTLFNFYEGETGFYKITNPEEVEKHFKEFFPDVPAIIPDLNTQFLDNPLGHLATVRCNTWHYKGQAAILGDAAHAVVPFFGQGMNCSFEDCSELIRCVDEFDNWEDVFANYQERRVANCNAIADLALENFIEMRDKVADLKFLVRKKVELKLEEAFPDKYITKYGMVTFHRMPYSEALRKGKILDLLLDELCEGLDSVDNLDLNKAKTLIDKYFRLNLEY